MGFMGIRFWCMKLHLQPFTTTAPWVNPLAVLPHRAAQGLDDMPQRWEQAIVIGAGIGGLLFARVLAERFARVLVLERDSLSSDPEPRSGVPQGRHLHALLAGGCRAMEALLPGLIEDMRAAGAVEVLTGWSNRVERPGYDPFPRRDLGFASFSLSRPLLELCIRRRVQRFPNILLQSDATVERLLLHEGGAHPAVVLRDGQVLNADFVVDASGRGELTLRALAAFGFERPRETTIGVDMNYASASFEIPADASHDWKSVVMLPKAPESSRHLLMSTIERQRWLCVIGWRGAEQAPTDRETYVEWTRTLRTQTCYQAIRDARMIGAVLRYAFPESRYRHFTQCSALPPGLLPVADAICRFNPIYGQGMSVAAQQALALAELLSEEQTTGAELLQRRFFQRCDQIIEGPWSMAAVPDFVYPDTRGQRPADLRESLKFGQAFTELAARDASVHKLMQEINSLLKPRSAMTGNPALMQRIYDVMSETTGAEATAAAG
jgi:2-polyprenyl-6-methoxyphenol hydroxylase-like FAD-dependent oxidoreductase